MNTKKPKYTEPRLTVKSITRVDTDKFGRKVREVEIAFEPPAEDRYAPTFRFRMSGYKNSVSLSSGSSRWFPRECALARGLAVKHFASLREEYAAIDNAAALERAPGILESAIEEALREYVDTGFSRADAVAKAREIIDQYEQLPAALEEMHKRSQEQDEELDAIHDAIEAGGTRKIHD